MYRIEEQEFYYRPTPKGADAEFDPVVWGDVNEKTVDDLADIFDIMKDFANTWDAVKMTSDSNGVFLTSGSDRENSDHPAHYFVPRHELRIYQEDI